MVVLALDVAADTIAGDVISATASAEPSASETFCFVIAIIFAPVDMSFYEFSSL
jgi:hypothetical protein